jgi:nucleotide-binding universal stress UspA family protein
MRRCLLDELSFIWCDFMFKRALICTDFSDSLQRLAKFVPDLAKSGLTHIVFFHNVALTTSREIPRVDEAKVSQAQQLLAVAKSAVPAGVTVEIEVASGRVLDNIARAVKKYQSDIIFSGMPIRSALNEQVFGSTSLGIVNKVGVPMLVLRPQLVASYRRAELTLRCQSLFDYLLIPYDGSSSAQKLIQDIKAKVQADCTLKSILLCWVIDDSGRMAKTDQAIAAQKETAQQALDQVKADLAGLEGSLEVLSEVRIGNPLEAVLKSGETHDVSAITICSGRSSGFLKKTVPSFTSAVLRASWYPIIHFPPAI